MFHYTDSKGIDHSIAIISPEAYEEVCHLAAAAGDWDMLAKFPPGPPLKMAYPNFMSYQDREGVSKAIYIPPDGDGKNAARATELFRVEDWDTLERESLSRGVGLLPLQLSCRLVRLKDHAHIAYSSVDSNY